MKALNKAAIALVILVQVTGTISYAAGTVRELKGRIEQEREVVKGKEAVKSFTTALEANNHAEVLSKVKESFKRLADNNVGREVMDVLNKITVEDLQKNSLIKFQVADGAGGTKEVSARELLKTLVEKNEAIDSLLYESKTATKTRTELSNAEVKALFQKQMLLGMALKNVTRASKTNRILQTIAADKKNGLLGFEKALTVIIEQVETMDAEQAKSYFKVLRETDLKMESNSALRPDEAFAAAIKEIYGDDAQVKLKDLIDCIMA
ncbi:MAG: hypothetical protein V4736_11815 [Bdellovibrionota bacterium]